MMTSVPIDVDVLAKEIALRPHHEASPEKMFSQLLDQARGSCRKPFLYQTDCNASGKADSKSQDMEGSNAQQPWVKSFRNLLLSGGIPLGDLSLSSEAMSGLRKLLLAEGFSESDVKNFLKGLFNDQGRGEIKILELLEKLSRLKEGFNKKFSDLTLDASVVPHMESLLRKLGLDPQEAGKVLEDSRVDGGGLNLKNLLSNLKAYIERLGEKGSESVNQQSLDEAMLARVGMAKEAAKIEGPISLERFIQMLDEKIAKLMPHSLSKDQAENEIKGLLNNVLVGSRRQDVKTGGSMERHYDHKLGGFLYDGLKNKAKHQGGNDRNRVNRNQGHTLNQDFMEAWKDPASGAKNAMAETEKLAQFQAKSDAALLPAKDLTEGARKVLSEKGFDGKHNEPVHLVKEGMSNRVTNQLSTAKEGARPIPLHVINQVGKRIGLAIRKGENHLRIRLRPPDLGSVQLDMAMKNNVLKVAMIAENHMVKELLMSHISELKQALVEHGVELQKVDVEIDYNFDRSMGDAQKDLKSTHWRKQRLASRSALGLAETGVEDIGEIAHPSVRGNTLLDMFA
ncbi:MAG: flagellar hook-length control protein FliK [Deltaproteobacteria bacterium]|nr:flagellar hook-length control protein FliK [Deltaproteobacteria bacterium]MBW2601286.1 flagellar hook-length control protein FliK [Deltaproteobacteria bacterium]